MSNFSKRALRWAAPVALVGALGLAACGNADTEPVRVAAPSVAGIGSDQHLTNKAEEFHRALASAGSDQHLNNKAVELAGEQRAFRAASASVGSDQHLNNKAVELAGEQRAVRAASASVGSDQHLNNKAVELASQRANSAWSARMTGQAEQIQRAEAARIAVRAEQFERSAQLDGQANTYGTDVPTNSDANVANAFEAGNKAAQAALAEGYVNQLQDRADSIRYILPGWHHVPSQ